MRKLLMLKHWQLVMVIILPAILFSATPFGEIIGAACGILFLLWIYAIGYYGQKQIHALGLQPMNLKLFQVNVLLLPIVLLVSKLPAFAIETSNLLNIVGIVLGIYSGFAAFQVLLFAGKTLAELEYRRKVFFGEYVRNSLQIIVFILGVWNLQTRVNRQFREPT